MLACVAVELIKKNTDTMYGTSTVQYSKNKEQK